VAGRGDTGWVSAVAAHSYQLNAALRAQLQRTRRATPRRIARGWLVRRAGAGPHAPLGEWPLAAAAGEARGIDRTDSADNDGAPARIPGLLCLSPSIDPTKVGPDLDCKHL
jgi:hypothetical protein